LECGDLSPLSYGSIAKSLAFAVSCYTGVKAATSRRTPNLALPDAQGVFQQPARVWFFLVCWTALRNPGDRNMFFL